MTIASVEPDLRQIIRILRDGQVGTAQGRTVDLIAHTCRMSGPMYREEIAQQGPDRDRPTYQRAAGRLGILTKDLREISFTMRRGTPAAALVLAERALDVFLAADTVTRA
jgi:hypothetical protein